MAARRDEPTRVAPYGAPGTRAICDSSIVPLGFAAVSERSAWTNRPQALIPPAARPLQEHAARTRCSRATLARRTAQRTRSLRDPASAATSRSTGGDPPAAAARRTAAQQDEARRRPWRGGLDETVNITPEALFDNRRTLDGQERA